MKIRNIYFCLALGIVWCFLLEKALQAQPQFGAGLNVEYLTLNSDDVFIGVLSAHESENESGNVEICSFKVVKCLKGGLVGECKIRTQFPAAKYEKWINQSVRLFICRDRANDFMSVFIEPGSDQQLVLDLDFRPLLDERSIVATAEKILSENPGAKLVESFRVVVPKEISREVFPHVLRTDMRVPVVSKAQTLALRCCQSGDYIQMCNGAYALRFFRNDQNEQTLRKLLDNQKSAIRRDASYNEGFEERVYGIREQAYESLRWQGIEVEKPMLRKTSYKPEAVHVLHLDNKKLEQGRQEQIGKYPNLREVHVEGAQFTDADILRLLKQPKLVVVWLPGTSITDIGLMKLAELPSLEKIYVGETKVTEEGVRKLQELRPDLKIFH